MNEPQSRLDKLLAIGPNGPAADVTRGRKHAHPPGWVPGIELNRQGGVLVTQSERAEVPADWSAILAELLPDGFNPDEYEVEGDSVEVRAWDGNVGGGELKRHYYFKARIRRKGFAPAGVNLDDVVQAARKRKIKFSPAPANERTYWIQPTDFQFGQGDGTGIDGQVARALELAAIVRADVTQLRKAGTPAGEILIPITGDLVEGTAGFYEMQAFSVQLDRRDQAKLVRRVLSEFLLDVATLGLPVHVAVVPGNHGENRNTSGKSWTTLNDNDDVAIVEQIAEAFTLAGVDGFTWSFPQRDRLSLTVEVQGWVVGLTHGHLARAGGGPETKILAWFKSMAAAREPIGDSDILFTGHYHSGKWSQLVGDTEWIQGGALCDTSAWFSQAYGLVTAPTVMRGTITREQKLEHVMPHRWPRTTPETRTL